MMILQSGSTNQECNFGEKLEELGSFSLRMRRLKEELIVFFKCLVGGPREGGVRLLSEMHCEKTREWTEPEAKET